MFSLFVGFSSLFVAPRGKQLALHMCWRGTGLSIISCMFVSIFFSGQSVVIDVERVGFRPNGFVMRRERMCLDARAFLVKNMSTKSNPQVSYMQ